jgi:hypothetical protein
MCEEIKDGNLAEVDITIGKGSYKSNIRLARDITFMGEM